MSTLIEILKTIILDAQTNRPETGIPRHMRMGSVKGKATICIGVRRSGKSTYMSQIIQQLIDKGVAPENILSLNLFDDRLHKLQHEGLGAIVDAFYSLYPEKKQSETVYCFFDEIQVIPGWEPFVDRLMRTEKVEVYITGSSAQLLSKEIATQMRGRALSWEMFPFSFLEFLDFKQLEGVGRLTSKKRLQVQKAFAEYWETGGFPEVAGLERRLRIKIHQEYFHTLLFRDLIERHDIAHPKAVSDLAHWLVDHIASLYSINRLTGYLKSLGHKVPKSAVSDYMAWLEDAYFLFTVHIFDASPTRRNANPKKIYCIDHALVTSISSGILINSGHLLENLVFTALRRTHTEIYYYKTKNGREVDFIVQTETGQRLLIQVSETLQDPRTEKREITALAEAMTELGLSSGIIVTRSEEKEVSVDAGTIEVISAWRFLFDLEKTH